MADPRNNIPNKNTLAKDWMQWHKDLLSAGLSTDDANNLWKAYWDKYASRSTDDNELRLYMKSYNVDISKGLDGLKDAGIGFGQGIGRFFKTGKYITMGVGAVLLFVILKTLLNISKNPIGAVNAVGNLKGGGIPK